jgi:hypothetical protein
MLPHGLDHGQGIALSAAEYCSLVPALLPLERLIMHVRLPILLAFIAGNPNTGSTQIWTEIHPQR